MNTTSLTIQGITFTASRPFAEGHVCSAAEAHQLNQARLDSLRLSFDKVVKKRLAGKPPSAETLVELRQEFAALDTAYSFKGTGLGSPVERKAIEIAREKLKEHYRAKGLKWDELGEAQQNEAIARVAGLERVRGEAERRIAQTQALAERGMGLEEVGVL